MRIKVIKCSSMFYWYRDLVGEEFDVEETEAGLKCKGYQGLLNKDDVVVVTIMDKLNANKKSRQAIGK